MIATKDRYPLKLKALRKGYKSIMELIIEAESISDILDNHFTIFVNQEIIRCKNCRFSDFDGHFGYCLYHQFAVLKSDFCSSGEFKANDDT